MATIPNIIDTGGGESIQSMYDKLNDLIDAFNNLAGGTAGQYPAKVDSTDFNFTFGTLPNFGTGAEKDSDLNWETINIGDWNMDSTGTVSVAHGLVASKIRKISAFIYADGLSNVLLPIEYVDILGSFGGSTTLVSGACSLADTNIVLVRTATAAFDNANFDSTGFNRGFITIGYVD